MSPLILIFITISIIFILTLYHSLLSNPNPNPKPPPLVKSHPLIGHLIAFRANRHRLLHWYTSLLSSSSSSSPQTLTLTITRLSSRTIVTADPTNVEHILKAKFPNYPKGPALSDLLGDLLGSGIFASDGPHWLRQRKLAAHRFSARSLRHLLLPSLRSSLSRLLFPPLIESRGARPVDLQHLLKTLTFDSICVFTLGVDSSVVPAPLAPTFDLATSLSALRATSPLPFVWKVKRVLNVGSERQLSEAVRFVRSTILDIVSKRRVELSTNKNDDNDHIDMLSELISGGHSDEFIVDMVVSFILAGRDTTAAALTWFFWLVSENPEIENEILKEIDGKDCNDYFALKEMRFLEASLLETMRLYPPVAWDSKFAEGDDILPDGTRVRRGDRVTYFPYGMGRMERIWGKDWAEFRPRRWTGPEGEVVRRSEFEYPVFQAGPRVCLGREMAMVQMKYVAAAVLGRFEVGRREGRPELVPLMTAHMAGGLNVVVKERRSPVCQNLI